MSVQEVQRDTVQLFKILAQMERAESYEAYKKLDVCREAVEIVLGMYCREDWR